jgi:hypothetical protein
MQLLLHPSDEPVFRLGIRAAQCALEVRINDVPVFQDTTGSALNLEMPLNEWLFQGSNFMQCMVSPLKPDAPFGPQAGLVLTLSHKFAREAAKNATEVGVRHWQPERGLVPGSPGHADVAQDDETEADELDDSPLLAERGQPDEVTWRHSNSVTLPNKSVRMVSSLWLPPPWPVCPWGASQALTEDYRTLFALQGLARGLHLRLQQKQYEDMFKLRRSALETAYYLDSEAKVDEALGFPNLLKDPNWQLQPMAESGLSLQCAGGGRLVRLVDDKSGDSPILLLNETLGVSAVLDAWWMFDSEWKLIR